MSSTISKLTDHKVLIFDVYGTLVVRVQFRLSISMLLINCRIGNRDYTTRSSPFFRNFQHRGIGLAKRL
jgi:hypothetical protein